MVVSGSVETRTSVFVTVEVTVAELIEALVLVNVFELLVSAEESEGTVGSVAEAGCDEVSKLAVDVEFGFNSGALEVFAPSLHPERSA